MPFQGGPLDGQMVPGEEQPAEAQGGGDPSEILRNILAEIDRYRQAEQDDEDLLQIEKVSTLVQQILANQQKDVDSAMGGKLSPKLMRRAQGGY